MGVINSLVSAAHLTPLGASHYQKGNEKGMSHRYSNLMGTPALVTSKPQSARELETHLFSLNGTKRLLSLPGLPRTGEDSLSWTMCIVLQLLPILMNCSTWPQHLVRLETTTKPVQLLLFLETQQLPQLGHL